MSSNFSLYFEALHRIKSGDKREHFDEKIIEHLDKWGYITFNAGDCIITQKGLNVLEFYLRNREFMNSCTSKIMESIIQSYA